MQNKPKVSVVAGIYYPPEICFRRFLDACLNQTIDNIEFIFLLDSPEDIKSRNILKEYKDLINNNKNTFKIIENEKNLDVVKTYIKGCKLSNSDNILIVDSDDFFDDDWIFQMYNCFINKNLDFLGPKILIGYVGKLDIFYALYDNDDPDDTGIMFKKEILNEYSLFKKYINYLSIRDIAKSDYKVSVLPLNIGSFYYYTVTDRSATSSFILQENESPKSKEYNFYKKMAIKYIENYLSKFMNKKINFNKYSLEELKTMAIKYINLDNLLDNDLTHEDLKGI